MATISNSLLYKSLSHHVDSILKRFRDDSLSDKQFLFISLNYDLFSSSLSLLNNIEMKNIVNPGVAHDCRKIIESFLFLKLYSEDSFDKEQLNLFRNHSIVTEYLNVKKTLNLLNESDISEFKQFYDDQIKKISEYYNLNKEQLKKYHVGDHYFCLQKNPKNPFVFADMFKEMNLYGKEYENMYDFFSIIEHPHFLLSIEAREKVDLEFAKYVNVVFSSICTYMQGQSYFVENTNDQDFKERFYQDALILNRKEIECFDGLFDYLISSVCCYKNERKFDLFEYDFLTKLKSLTKDVLVSIALGDHDVCVSKIKPILELISVHEKIALSINRCEYKIRVTAFNISTKEQFYNLLFDDIFKNEFKDYKDIFDNYYRNKYSIDNIDDFIDKITHNSKYVIDKEKCDYRKLIQESTNKFKVNQPLINELYDFGSDFAHGGGYSFNASPVIVKILPFELKMYISAYLYFYITLAELSLKEHLKETDFEPLKKFLKEEIDGCKKQIFEIKNELNF